MRRRLNRWWWLNWLVLAVALQAADGPLSEARQLAGDGASLLPGSPANLAMEEHLEKVFAEAGLEHGAIRFPAPAFRPGGGTLRIGEGSYRLWAMHPTLIRPGNFPEDKFEAPLVYLGRGTTGDLAAVKGMRLSGAVGVMEFDCGRRWEEMMRFGLKGIVFLGADTYAAADAASKVYASEAVSPRFFVGREDSIGLRKALGVGSEAGLTAATGSFDATPSRWERTTLRDVWAFAPGIGEDAGKKVIVLVAALDGNSVVPGQAADPSTALNAYLLARLAQELAEKPAAHSVLLVGVNAHTQLFLGERQLCWNLLAPMAAVDETRGQLANAIRLNEMFLRHYRALDFSGSPAALSDQLVELRSLVDSSTGRRVTVKDPIVALIRRDVNETKAEKVRLGSSGLPEAELAARLEELKQRQENFVTALMLFNRVGHKTEYIHDCMEADGVTPKPSAALVKGYVDTLVDRYGRWARLSQDELNESQENTRIRDALGGRPVSLVMNLRLNWEGDQLCLGANSWYQWYRRLGVNVTRLGRQVEKEEGLPEGSLFVDALTSVGGLSERFYLPQGDACLSFFHASRATPAVTLSTPFVSEGDRFLPEPSWDGLSPDRIAALFDSTSALVTRVLNTPMITESAQLPRPRPSLAAWSTRMEAFEFDPFSASVMPELPLPNTMVVLKELEDRTHSFYEAVTSGNVVDAYTCLVDERASSLVVSLNNVNYHADAYHMDADWRTMDHVVDAGDVLERMTAYLSKGDASKRLALFRCKEITIPWRGDSAVVGDAPIDIHQLIVLEARQNSIPRKYGLAGISAGGRKDMRVTRGPVAIYVEPETRVKLVANTKALAIGATEQTPEGAGFDSSKELGPDFFLRSTEDLAVLNRYRLERMAGVTNQLADEFTKRGDGALAEAETARKGRDHVRFLEQLAVAEGAQMKAYGQIAQLTNDMLKAVVFYVLLLVPFCFFVQKLCFKFVRIEAQMAAFVGLFVATFALFRLIHPAFRVAQAAEAIFVALVMGLLGGFVIVVLHRRFEGEMQLLFQTYLGAGAEVGASTVGQKAMLIGVNNMKRRRIRTLLTTATIVLITFAMLAFSSVSKKSSPTIVTKRLSPPYKGLFYQWPGSLQMDDASLQVVEHLFAGEAKEMVVRRWLKRTQTIPVKTDAGQSLTIEALLGLGPGDATLLSPDGLPILPGGHYFSDNRALEALVPVRLAKALGLGSEDVGKARLRIGETWFRVVGLLDDDAFRELKDLNNLSILPVKEVERGGFGDTARDASMRIDPTEDNESSVFFVDTSSLVVVPEGRLAAMGGAPFSVSVVLNEQASLWDAIDRLLTATGAKFYVSSKETFGPGRQSLAAGVYYVGSGYKTSIGGLSRLLIPLLIAGTIILNTMLGSVYERKYEIAVYNAIGLNPTHIRWFFLAEALVYSVIGSVGGYLIGQGLAIVLIKTGLVGDLNLNFSSLAVLYVIGFTIAIVLLSTLYPAIVATRLAVPSGKRKWSLPEHDGKRMEVVFPFIYQDELALGVVSYLEQYFARFTEASIGDLIARLDGYAREKDAAGRDTYRLTYDIALAPFDLGVTQTVEFRVAYDEVVQSYRMVMTVIRNSGQDSNWVTTNRPFLERLRKYLIQWRNMEPGQHAVYVSRADSFFGGAVNS